MTIKSIYTKELGKLVAQSAKEIDPDKFRVLFSNGMWAVVRDGGKRALRRFTTTKAAVNYAKKRGAARIVIHAKNGQPLEWINL